jgi:hypothetical protein
MVVKVSHTARDDINGLLGIVMSYNTERERYLVHMTAAQSTMAFKKENLVAANTFETYKAQYQQLRNDPRVKEKMLYYLQQCRNWVSPWNLQYVLLVGLVTLIVLMYFFGFTKTVMVLSYAVLLLVIAGPDILAKKSPKLIADNFPNRARMTIEQHVPMVRGKVSNRVAIGVVLLMGALVLQSLFFVKSSSSTSSSGTPPTSSTTRMPLDSMSDDYQSQKELLTQYYSLGFQDATDGTPHGTSLLPALNEWKQEDHANSLGMSSSASDYPHVDDSELSSSYVGGDNTPDNKSQQFGSITNAMSMFYLYRTVMELGKEQMTGLFSMAQLMANVHGNTIPIWRKGLLVLSAYKVLRIFI